MNPYGGPPMGFSPYMQAPGNPMQPMRIPGTAPPQMPMQMGMMPPMMGGVRPPYPPMVPQPGMRPMTTSPSVPLNGGAPYKLPDQMTTVYVGKIPTSVEDDFIRKLLEQCGKVTQWRRVSDPLTGKPKGFGFCDYSNADGVLRALRILNKLVVDDSELLLRVDEKTQKYLEEYENKVKPNINAQQQAKDDEKVKAVILEIIHKKFGSKTRSPTRKAREEAEEERDVIAEREARKRKEQEKEEKEFIEREKDWEKREKAKLKEREKESKERTSNRTLLDQDYDYDIERKRHSRDYYRKKREREREKQDDEAEKLNELHNEANANKIPIVNSIIHSPIKLEEVKESTDSSLVDKNKISLSLSLAPVTQPVEKKPLNANVPLFNQEVETEESANLKKKRKLALLDAPLHEENTRQVKLEQVKSVIEKIPTEKEKIFDFPMDWEMLDRNSIVDNQMRTWVTKQIGELLGEEEKTLIDFILSKITSKIPPRSILEQLSLVLDEEAESFVIKMWRRLIYEMLSAKELENKSS